MKNNTKQIILAYYAECCKAAEEAALSVEEKDRKNVRIDAVNQTTDTYFETVEIYTIDELIKE